VNTIPPIIKEKIDVELGKNNTVQIKCPTGTLKISHPASDYKNLQILVKQDGKILTLTNLNALQTERFLIGNYDVEILTLPRIYKTVTIKQSQVTELNIPAPGTLNIGKKIKGFGSIYSINKDGTQQWITNFPHNHSQLNLPMQPGNYRLVFMAEGALHSEATQTLDFKINAGLTTNLNLY
ncbi:MAG TPA: hypothetical protein VL947_06170, partial [Cytophagales bacterium]|nr:hypothetical protein [Cytophagales bacterium]